MEDVTIVGAGPTGSLMALLLARRGYKKIRVFEYRSDPREAAAAAAGKKEAAAAAKLDDASLAKVADAAKRSINLTLSHRGLCALRRAGIDEAALRLSVPVRGRMIHDKQGGIQLQAYDPNPERVMHSIGREVINTWLLAQLSTYESSGVIELCFGHKCLKVSPDGSAEFLRIADGQTVRTAPARLLGCDGAFSVVRTAMARMARVSVSVEYIEHGYKELSMAPKPSGAADESGRGLHRMPAEGLHIWPGSEVMLIALPNIDGSFTCTIFGDFALLDSLTTEEQVRDFFGKTWPDTLDLIPDLPRQYLANRNAALGTVRCWPWHIKDSHVLLLGDAAHGVVPFYGQGMNCAFEDCLLLDEALVKSADDWTQAVPAYAAARKPATDALATLAVDNYEEMRDKTVDRTFLVKCKLHEALHAVLGERWQPSLHTAVTFTSMPYHEAKATFERQDRMLTRAVLGATTALVALGARAALRSFQRRG